MNQINIVASDTPVLDLTKLPGYNPGDQYLLQIGRFTITIVTDANCQVILPPVKAFRLGTANFFIADLSGGGGVVTITTKDASPINGSSSFVFSNPFQSASIQLLADDLQPEQL